MVSDFHDFRSSLREVLVNVEEAVLVPVVLEVEENAVEVAGFLLEENKIFVSLRESFEKKNKFEAKVLKIIILSNFGRKKKSLKSLQKN